MESHTAAIRRGRTVWRPVVFTLLLLAGTPVRAAETGDAATRAAMLHERNLEAPFCYRPGGERSWSIAGPGFTAGQRITLTARREQSVLTAGEQLQVDGLTVRVAPDGRLHVESGSATDAVEFTLSIAATAADGTTETQSLTVRPAPPDRPLSYIADFGDDIIVIFGQSGNRYRPIEKAGFDQYFRRLQAQGITRLIVWLSPFPYIADAADYETEDWQRYAAQARAILDSADLRAGIESRQDFSAWGWLRQLLALRLMPEFGQLLSDSAGEHGIRLAVSFRPFEPALTKYYVVPAFDADGTYLWDFQPLCSPAVNYHVEDVCFAHYREILRRMGHADVGRLATIELPGVPNAAELVARFQRGVRDLELRASRFPPLAAESFVLVRGAGGAFALRPYREISGKSLSRQVRLAEYRLTAGNGGLRIENVRIPDGHHYVWLTQAAESDADVSVSTEQPVLLTSAAGTPLGSENVWFALHEIDGAPQPTRVSGIPPDGHYHAEFQATEASIELHHGGPARTTLKDRTLVVDLGPDWSIEMLDFTQPAARAFAVRQLQTVLKYPAFDEIFLNTRSHTQLAGYVGDDGAAVRPIAALRREGRYDYHQLGLDEAYAPRDAAADSALLAIAANPGAMTKITQLQPLEWREQTCHAPQPFAWRYARNRLVADGVRQLILDLERAFPHARIRAVLPPRAAALEAVFNGLDSMPAPAGGRYGRAYYRQIWSSNNHIPNIGDGMALVNLRGTRVEPVLHGIRFLPDDGPLDLFIDQSVNDLAGARGSTDRVPLGVFYEAQETLRSQDPQVRQRREAIICRLLARPDIGEVILYEAADWVYNLPWQDADLYGHGFLDRCENQ